MVEGDDHGEAYTAIMWGMGMSHEMLNAGAEAFAIAEGKMSGTVMRGAVALPGSKAISRLRGTRRNLGDLASDHRPCADLVRIGKARSRSR